MRTGPIFRAYTSYNGVTWGLPVNTQVIDMEACLEVGLIVTNVPYATNVTATFSHVYVDGGDDPERPAGISIHDGASLHVYPNPTSGQLTVNLTAFLEQEAQLEVTDVNGQLMLRRSLGVVEHGNAQLDLSGLPAGLYFVRLQAEDGTMAVQRIVLQPRP
ncbi:MAG: T9SS type A sorting domain-containing protein [Lewinella sp.]|nr:T9SS type A sorting domain-containing protein [Lewinella sp.]